MRRLTWAVLAFAIGLPAGADARDVAPRAVVAACSQCHGRDADQHRSLVPRINGQRPHYILRRLIQLGEAERDGKAPHGWLFANNIPAGWRLQIADYFAALPATVPDAPDAASLGAEIYRRGIPERNVAPCRTCHGAHGEGDGPVPRLAGQRKAYLQIRLDILSGFPLPGSGAMHFAVTGIAPAEIDAITAYLAAK